ncbi:hypothetical protein EUTSA_v10023329mg [Eutrema salsugineum]|uniref:Leucine-rich repeat-containing N-terminal plant-type domain-containing protein n=2 Tax=Eutrema salsugineum TaxID=72664 RepID=V4KQI9_EUTSA|nr:hypothetical protein EUTSA_v10023329mg [Eutrema salsugineum]
MSNLNALEYLSLSDNVFEGFFSFDSIANLSKLKVFRLSSRSSLFHTDLEIPWQPRFQLSIIELQYCNLGTVPIFLQHQKDLRLINLSNNKLTGELPSWLLEQNPKLGVLLLQNNSFTMLKWPRLLLNHSLKVLDLSTNKFSGQLPNNIGMVLPNLRHLNLSNNGFQGNLPSSSGKMNMLQFLDLSHNYLSGILPRKFLMGCYSLRILKLSHNRFSGVVFSEQANLTSLSFFKADNNRFTAIAAGLSRSNGLLTLDMSSNYLQGVIPSWFGDFSFWYLLVSGKLLNGAIPRTMFNKSTTIALLDLSRNKFLGNLPECFNCKLMFLNDNEFSGVIPNTFLQNVEVLDLRNNNLSGKIPRFVSNVFIKYLLLRGNRLTGDIPKDLCSLSSIKILDLANNKLNGSIPSCLNNVSFGRSLSHETDVFSAIFGLGLDIEVGAYSGSLDLQPEFNPPYNSDLKFIFEFASKSRYDSYNEGSLDYMFGLDLSNNELSGEIPGELGDLHRIRSLNLSHNSLSGLIPKSFTNLTDIESIDLSFNVLHGSISQDLGKLHYMVVFNVSYNNLSGSIPSQGKFSTLDETNYIANPLLCGPAINTSCDDSKSTIGFFEPDSQNEDEDTTVDMEIFYWSLAATYGVTLMTFIVFLCFDSPWRRAWFCLVDAFINLFKCV